jgi:predicted transcriptional regulator
MSKRASYEIIAEILSLCEEPQTKTRIMYLTNLSHRSLEEYLARLQSLNLLELHHSIPRYVTTEKGRRFLQKWSELVGLLDSAGPNFGKKNGLYHVKNYPSSFVLNG